MTSPSPSPTGGPGVVASSPTATVAQLSVEGMHCGACVDLIEETLSEAEGVVGASVDLASARAMVTYEPELIDLDAIRTLIADTGYTATPVG